MATTIDWGTKIITVAQADMIQTQVSPIPIYQLNVNDLHLDLRLLESSALGMAFLRTHTYNAPVTLSGVTYARLMEILNGYTIEFDPDGSGTPYVVQVVGGNSNVGDVIQPQPGVSVQVANSAGLQDAEALQAASFDGAVALDIVDGIAGTTFPIGTLQAPSSNLADARSICIARGIRNITVLSSMTLGSGDFSDGYTFNANSPILVQVTIDTAADITNCRFRNMTVTGVLDGNNEFRECVMMDLTIFNGGVLQCALVGTITLGGGVQAQIYDSWSGVANGYCFIDVGGTGQDLILRNFSGSVSLLNSTGPADISLNLTSGKVELQSTVSDGLIEIRGNARVSDNSTGTAVVNNNTALAAQELAAFNGKITVDPISGTTGEYEYPYGTAGSPVLTVADAIQISANRGITTYNFLSDYTFNSGDDVTDRLVSGRGPNTELTFLTGSITTRTAFTQCHISGEISRFNRFDFCHFGDVTDVTVGAHNLVQFQQCAFNGTWTFSTSHVMSLELLYCVTGAHAKVLNGGKATFDFNGSDVDAALRNYSGAVELKGISNALADVSADFFSGSALLDASCTAGDLILRGDCIVTDNSAGTTVQNVTTHAELEAASFNGHVTVDESNSTGAAISGEEYPAGTDKAPALTVAQAMLIARARGLVECRVVGPTTVLVTDNIVGMTFFCRLVGSSVNLTAVGASVNRTAFINLAVYGTLEERSSFKDCFVFASTFLRARLTGCGLSQTLNLTGGGTSVLEDCYSGYPLGQNNLTPADPIIDLGGTGQSLRMSGWTGNCTIQNLTDAAEYVEIDSQSGNIVIASTITAGTIVIRGYANVTDNSTGTASVTIDTDYSRTENILDRVQADHDIITTPGELVVTKANTATELDRYDLDDTDGATFNPTGSKGIGSRTRQ